MPLQKIPELLAPVGNMDQLESAILYGANAVYLGGSASLRASRAFSAQDLAIARKKTKDANVKLFFCCNAFPRQHQMSVALENLELGARSGVDAFIIADAGVLTLAKKHFAHIPIHLSTQANTCNADSVSFWHSQGASRINLARELRFSEISSIAKANSEVELECFVHGAQCLAISGQCLLSAWLNNRPANAGQCTQPCRFEYRPMPGKSLQVEETLRQGEELWEITQGEEGFSAFWAPEDLCLLPFVPWFQKQQVTALKIEGRMRSGAYVSHVVDVYRQALDFLDTIEQTHVTTKDKRRSWRNLLATLISDLALWSSRNLGSGFFIPKHQQIAAAHSRERGGLSPLLARLEEEVRSGVWRVSVRSQWASSRSAYIFMPGGLRPQLLIGEYSLENHRGIRVDCVHPGMEAFLHCSLPNLISGAYVEGI